MRRLALLEPRRLQLLVVVLPVLLTALYLWLFAADRYVSESTLAVRQASGDATAMPGAAMLLAGISPPAREDTLYVRRYVHSLDLLNKLDAELKVREHYRSPGRDPLFGLWSSASQEKFLNYYRDRVELVFDDVSGLLTIRVQAFDPAVAQRLNRRILEESERFVNEYSHRMARERLAFAESELKAAADRVQASKNAVLDFQNRNRLLDPTYQAQATGALTAELEATRARLQSELNGLLVQMNKDAPEVRTLRARIEATQKQIAAERERGTTAGRQGDRLNALAIEFQALTMQADFSVDAYKLALAAVENARIDATRKLKSLVVIDPPSKAESAEYPRRLYVLVTVLVASLLVYAILRLVLATVREHQD
jgi:capsular polysaccharide transport system permease protein